MISSDGIMCRGCYFALIVSSLDGHIVLSADSQLTIFQCIVVICLTFITPCGFNLTPEDHFHELHKNHQHHSSEILWLCQAIYCDFISDNVLQFHA